MNERRDHTSLRLRLLGAALITTAIALGLAGLGLTLLFERHLSRALDGELAIQLNQLVSYVEIDDEGRLTLEEQSRYEDPRFTRPLSGYYWQITEIPAAGETRPPQRLTSRSLWDQILTLPFSAPSENPLPHRFEIAGPNQSTLVALERRVTLTDTPDLPVMLQLVVARDIAYLKEARANFGYDLSSALGILGLILLIASAIQVYVGLKPLELLRREVHDIRQRRANRLHGGFPREVRPLADELNTLLDSQHAAITRARERAADLAHGLMTPLTAMMATARRLRERGQHDLSDDIEQLTEQMRLHVGQEMARARLQTEHRSGPPQDTPIAETAAALFRTLQRTPTGETLCWELDAPPGLRLALERHDLTELLGNLLDNAARHAAGKVRLSVREHGRESLLLIEDDGHGIPAPQRENMLQRGTRLDSVTGQGAGLGLSIVARIVDAYGGTIALEQSALGGLKIVIRFPSARD